MGCAEDFNRDLLLHEKRNRNNQLQENEMIAVRAEVEDVEQEKVVKTPTCLKTVPTKLD